MNVIPSFVVAVTLALAATWYFLPYPFGAALFVLGALLYGRSRSVTISDRV